MSERLLPDIGLIKALDPETGREEWIDSSSKQVREAYREWWKSREGEVTELLTRCGVDNMLVSTGEDYIIPLIKLFKMR